MKNVYFVLLMVVLGLPYLSSAQVMDDSQTTSNALMGEVQTANLNALNSEGLDFSPVYFDKGIIFTSTRQAESANASKGWFKRKYTDLFYSALNGERSYDQPIALSPIINTKYHDGIATFNSTGTKMYFSRNDKKPSGFGKKTIQLKIFSADRLNNTWSGVIELPINVEKYSSCHPTLSADGKFLYFASNRPGGFGGMDLYVSEFKNGKWQPAQNMGSSINTKQNELFPHMAHDGTLYFASNGHLGMGELDIFKGEKMGEDWKVRNMGKPFNSWKDDFGFVMHQNQQEGFFSSNRSGGKGKDDIYSWTTLEVTPANEPILSITTPKQETVVKGIRTIQVIDKDANHPLKNVKVVISEANKPGMVIRYFTDENGRFNFKWDSSSRYFFAANKDGYLPFNKILSKEEMAGDEIISISLSPDQQHFALQAEPKKTVPKIVEKPIVKEKEIDEYFLKKEENMFTEGQLIQLDNIYYDFNEYVLQNEAKQELERVVELLSTYPDMEIELNAHTDAIGSADYNQKLSEKRARSAVNYITSNGIAKERVSAIGFGESRLLYNCGTEINCSSKEQAMNRRTEFLIKKVGSKVVRSNQSPSKNQKSSKPSAKAIKTKSDKMAKVMMRPIYYEFASAQLWDAAKEELDKVADLLMRHPGMKIRVASYTDVVGKADYNLRLSAKRAKIAAEYILSKGIAKERVDHKGYGETEINNHCKEGVNCSIEERKINRRTEIQITEPGGAELANINEE